MKEVSLSDQALIGETFQEGNTCLYVGFEAFLPVDGQECSKRCCHASETVKLVEEKLESR